MSRPRNRPLKNPAPPTPEATRARVAWHIAWGAAAAGVTVTMGAAYALASFGIQIARLVAWFRGGTPSKRR